MNAVSERPAAQLHPGGVRGNGRSGGDLHEDVSVSVSKLSLIVKPTRIVSADDVKRYNFELLGGKSVNIWTGDWAMVSA
jgi:hypothetical protein